jgi:hypothetical protein
VDRCNDYSVGHTIANGRPTNIPQNMTVSSTNMRHRWPVVALHITDVQRVSHANARARAAEDTSNISTNSTSTIDSTMATILLALSQYYKPLVTVAPCIHNH